MLAEELNPAVEEEFTRKKIDRELTLSILERYNRGDLKRSTRPELETFPQIDGERVIMRAGA